MSNKKHKSKNKVKIPTLAEQASSTSVALTDILSTYELVEVVENNGDPFVIVSPKSSQNNWEPPAPKSTSRRMNTLSDGDPRRADYDMFGRSLREPGVWLDDLVQAGSGMQLSSAPGKQMVESGKKLVDYTDVSIGELGSSSVSPFTSWIRREYNNDLVGVKGLQVYDKMRKSDGTVRGTLRTVKAPVLTARWFMSPDDTTKVADKNAAEYIWKNLTHMSISWPQILVEALLMIEFGYYMFEIVWEEKIVDGKPRLWVKKLAPRHPMDVYTWHFDANGGPAGVTMFSPTANPIDEVTIPIDKLLVFSFDREAGDIEGISLLRSAYKHWYYIDQFYKIDSIQKERHGIGIPVIKLPPGFSTTDKQVAENLGRNLRTNERAHVVLPPNWDLIFAELTGQPVNALLSVKEHKEALRESILLGFMGADNPTTEDDQQMFYKATRFIADIVRETFNLYLIPKMMDANFQRVGYPTLNARRIGEEGDWRTLSFSIRNLIGSGALIPDKPLEEFLREMMDLPAIDEATRRLAATPFNKNDPADTPSETDIPGVPGSPVPVGPNGNPGIPSNKQSGAIAGLPRQGPPPTGKPKGNGGIDTSGGAK